MTYDIAEAVREWLDGVEGFDAYTFVPAERPARFQTVERTGGGVRNALDRPLLAVQFWAGTPQEAMADALQVRDMACKEGARPAGCHLTVNAGPYPYDDPESGQARAQLVFECVTHI